MVVPIMYKCPVTPAGEHPFKSLQYTALWLALVWSTVAGAADVTGAWWRLLPGPAGAPRLQVWELRPDGEFITHGPAQLQDRGRYAVSQGVIHVESALNPAQRGDIGFRMTGQNAMTLAIPPPLNQVQQWKRVGWAQEFELASIGTSTVPEGVDRMVTRTVAEMRGAWRPDALPERLELRPIRNGDMQATLDLCSPSDGACLRVSITRFARQLAPYQRKPGPRRGFPATFMDLSRAVKISRGLGYDGRLTRARIGFGSPDWGLSFRGGRPGTAGLVLDAITGKPVVHDMNQVMADYNRQWDEVLANLRQRRQQNQTGDGGPVCPILTHTTMPNGSCAVANDLQRCSQSGGTWQYGGCYHY